MANTTPPSELRRLEHLEAPDSQPTASSLGIEMQSLDNRTTSVSCGSQESRSGQSLGESAGPPRRISQDAVTEHHEEQITLLPREDPTILEIPRSSSKDAGKPDSNVPAVTLHKSSYIVLMVSIYASLALTAWILTCLLTFRPLTTRHYGYDTRDKNEYRSFYDTILKVRKAAKYIEPPGLYKRLSPS